MVGAIIGMAVGLMVLCMGLSLLHKEKEDRESVKIYGTISAIGVVVFIVTLIILLTKVL